MPESSRTSNLRAALLKYAANVLSARPHFRSKLKEKLFFRAQKLGEEDPGSVISSILDDLADGRFLDDAYLAGGFVRRQLSKCYGPKIITFKLRYMGLDGNTIKAALEEEAGEQAQLDACRKYMQKYTHQDPRLLRAKLYGRGFPSSIINMLK